jgi:CCR4-NOT complex subunit CAF16
LKPYEVLLCDEITVDLDILGRLDLLKFFEEECEERGATIIYATHIFDGMHDWMTHLAFISNGELKYGQGGRKEDIEEIKGIDHLLSTIEDWLRVDRDETKARKLLEGPKKRVDPYAHFGSRQMSYYGC